MDYSKKSREELINELETAKNKLREFELASIKRQNAQKELRSRAEELLLAADEKKSKKENFSDQEFHTLLEELNVHQIELELQNEELRDMNYKLLLESEKYKELYDNAPIAYITLNATGNIINLNQAAADLMGLPKHWYKFTSIFPFISEDSKRDFYKYFKRVFDSQFTEYGHVVFVNSEGKELYVLLQTKSYFDADYNDQLCRLTITDISKEKNEAEHSLQQSEQKLLSLIDAIPDMLFHLDRSGRFLSFHQSAEHQLFTEPENFLGKRVSEVFDDKFARDVLKAIEITLENGSYQFSYDMMIDKKRYYEARLTKLNEFEVVAIVTDVTTNIEHQQSLVENEQKFRSVFDNSSLGIMLCNTKGEILDANAKLIQMLGYSKSEFYSYNFLEFSAESDYETHNRHFNKLINGITESYTLELRLKHKNGTDKWMNLSVTSKKNENNPETMLIGMIQDIDIRKKSEQLLAESEEKFRIFFNFIQDAIIVHPVLEEGFANFADANQVAVDRYGYSKKEFLQLTIKDLLLPSDLKRVIRDGLLDKLQEKGSMTFEVTHIDKHGNYIPVETRSSIVVISGQKYYLSLITDLRERKNTEQKIYKLNKRIEAAMRSGNMAWWEMTLPSGEVNFNSNKAFMLGYEASKFKHYNDFMALVHPDDYEDTMQAFREHLHGNAPTFRFDYRIKHRDGQYLWFKDVGKITEKNGEEIKLAGIVRDVTARKQAEEQVNKLRTAIEQSTVGIAIFNSQGLIEFVNPIFTDYVSTKTEDLNGKNINNILSSKADDATIQELWDTIKKAEVWEKELFNDSKQGEFWEKHTAAPILDRNSKIEHVLLIIEDITARKHNEALLIEKEQNMRDMVAAKEKFFSIIAHDLRSPFSGFLNLSAMLQDEWETITKEDLKEISTQIHNSANSIYKLINDLLTWSRAQTGDIALNKEEIDIYEIILDNIFLLSKAAEKKNIKLIINSKLNTIAHCDRNMVMTVLRNLIDNAIKFSKNDSKITISSTVTEKEGTKFIQVSVADNGIGMNKKIKEEVFSKETKYSRPGTAGEAGTGLGLHLCRDFISMNDGEIWFETEENKGTVFNFTLPFVSEDAIEIQSGVQK